MKKNIGNMLSNMHKKKKEKKKKTVSHSTASIPHF